jgi:hypothetical protein
VGPVLPAAVQISVINLLYAPMTQVGTTVPISSDVDPDPFDVDPDLVFHLDSAPDSYPSVELQNLR